MFSEKSDSKILYYHIHGVAINRNLYSIDKNRAKQVKRCFIFLMGSPAIESRMSPKQILFLVLVLMDIRHNNS